VKRGLSLKKTLSILLVTVLLSAFFPSGVMTATEMPGNLNLPIFKELKDVAYTERVYIATGAEFTEYPDLGYRVYPDVYFIEGDTPTEKQALCVSLSIPTEGKTTEGFYYKGEYLPKVGSPFAPVATGVYEFGFNENDVAVAFVKSVFDPYLGYGTPDMDTKTIRIGEFGNAAGDIHNTYKFDENTKVFFVEGALESLTLTMGRIEDLVNDENDIIRIFYNYVSMTDRTLTEVYIEAVEGVGERSEETANRYWSDGVEWNDPVYGYDGVENPWAPQFLMYDPIIHGGNTEEAKYPLFVYVHGFTESYSGKDEFTKLNDGMVYTQPSYQEQFETDTAGVNGAFVMSPYSTPEKTSTGELSWQTGYREDSNPRYKLGNEEYKGKHASAAAIVSNILWVLDTYPNIDRNKVYIAGFSIGGYTTWATLFEAARLGHSDLFAAALPQEAAFFPSGGQLDTDYGEFEAGLEDKLLSVKDTAIWVSSSLRDWAATWVNTTGDYFRMNDNLGRGIDIDAELYPEGAAAPIPMEKIGGATTLWEAMANLKDVGGNPLTRVSIHTSFSHQNDIIIDNNTYPTGTEQREGVTPTTYTRIYGEQPDGYDERGGEADLSIAYTFGASAVYSTGSYDDTVIDWFNACGYAKSIINSVSPDKTSLSALMTRGMAVSVLWHEEGEPDFTGDFDGFTDVAEGSYYEKAIAWAAGNGIINGYGDGRFGSGDKVTRQDFAVILMRYMSYKKINLPVTSQWLIFADEASIDSYAMDAVQTLCKLDIMAGTGTNSSGQTVIDPKGTVSGAELAGIFRSLLWKIQ